MNGIYTKKMRGAKFNNMLTLSSGQMTVAVAPGGYQAVPLRVWSILMRQVQIQAGVFKSPKWADAREQLRAFHTSLFG
jgi:hypothetical protein